MIQFGLDPHRPARALKVEGVPKLSIEQNGIFLTANNSKVIKYEPFLTFYLLKPLVKVTTHVGSDCVLDCLLARGTEFGTVTIISVLQYFFYFRLFCFRQLFGEF